MSKRTLSIFLVVIAGEAIFMLPFVIPRLYRPLMLEAWGISNTDFGQAFAAYGLTAMISYLFGGPLADRFHPRTLMSLSLFLTAFGGIYLISFPGALNLIATYAFFGVSTIFLMWGALIKTTHVAGGNENRSLAMGILDGGRGLAAAAYASGLVFIIYLMVPELTTAAQQGSALRVIYVVTVCFLIVVALGIWFLLKDFIVSNEKQVAWNRQKIVLSLKSANVWLLSIVILGSYCAYKAIDNYATYLVTVQKLDLARSSLFTSLVFWARPISAIATGFIADHFHNKNHSARFFILAVLLVLSGAAQFFLASAENFVLQVSFAVMISSAAFAYALRTIYFSLFGDLNVPNNLIGTTVGIVSFVGFMPDIFFGWVTGRLIDENPGALGFQLAFDFTGVCVLFGAIASFMLLRRSPRP